MPDAKRPRFKATSSCVGRMELMPKESDGHVKSRTVWLVPEHQQEYPELTAAYPEVAGRSGSVRSQCVGG